MSEEIEKPEVQERPQVIEPQEASTAAVPNELPQKRKVGRPPKDPN